MPRTARMIVPDEQAVYHVMSRTALDEISIGDVEKNFMLKIIKQYAGMYLSEILGYCIMRNHFHLLVKMLPENDFSDKEIWNRCQQVYGVNFDISDERLPMLRKNLASLSGFIRDIKANFARYYNRRHHRRGNFWGERFKSVIADRRETLVNCLAYIDLNQLRASLVKRLKEFRWS